MRGFELVLLLLAVSVALRLVADRFGVPHTAILVVGGLVLALIPGLPRVSLPPDVLFLIFVPPLLYWGAGLFPLRQLQHEAGAMVRLAVVLVVVSTAAVAVVAHAMDPAFTWAAAWTLGAIVSPPDPVAVLAAMRSLRLPRLVQSILEGEGLLNDGVALIAYRVAVAAAVTGVFSPKATAVRLLLSASGGIAIGWVVGIVVTRVRFAARSVPAVGNTVSLLTPFAAYLPAEHVGASGVLAVVTTALYVARAVPKLIGAEGRIQLIAMWTVVTFVLESLAFILVGLELPYVTRALEHVPFTRLLGEAVAVSACLVLVRLVWVLPSTYVFRGLGRWLRHGTQPLPGWRAVLFVALAGLRGSDSLVLALALPLQTASGARFPASDEIVFITFVVIFITLVIQGPMLPPLARRLRLARGAEDEREESHARLVSAEAGLAVLDDPAIAATRKPEVVRYLRQRHRQRARRWAAHEAQFDELPGTHDHVTAAPSHDAGVLDTERAGEYRRIRALMIQVEQRAVLDLRDRGEIDDEVMRRVVRDLDLESILLGTRDPVVEPPSEVSASIDGSEP